MKTEDFHKHLEKIKEFLNSQLIRIRVGRATTSLVEEVKIDAYEGADPLPLNEVATISVPEPHSILIAPWDKSILGKIEEAIRESEKGFSPVNDGESIRITIPPLTKESREVFVKEISKHIEGAKIKVRTLRQDVMKAIEEQQHTGVISKDEAFRQKKLIEEDVSKANKELEEIGEKKKEEIMEI